MHLSYPQKPVSIGEHIKKKRMDLRQFQSDVAKIFGVSTDCVTYWENNRSTPQLIFYPKIMEFLGYSPLDFDKTTLSGRIKAYRHRMDAPANEINVNRSKMIILNCQALEAL